VFPGRYYGTESPGHELYRPDPSAVVHHDYLGVALETTQQIESQMMMRRQMLMRSPAVLGSFHDRQAAE